MSGSEKEEVLQELRRITKLLVLLATKGQIQKEQIRALDKIGFQPKEIADMLRTTPPTVRSTLYEIRKKAKVEEVQLKGDSETK